MSKTSSIKDKDGFLLLEKEFKSQGFLFKWVEDLPGGWSIYSKSSIPNRDRSVCHVKYELVKPSKDDAYEIHGNKVAAKYSYPSTNSFGKTGFDCASLASAHDRYKQIMSDLKPVVKEKLNIPTKKEFSISNLIESNPTWNRGEIGEKLNTLISQGRVKLIGQSKERGHANIYKFIK